MQKIVTNLWFHDRVDEALDFYTSLLPGSRVLHAVRHEASAPGDKGNVIFADFELAGQQFTIIAGNPDFAPSETFSLCVQCEDQAEIDRLWEALTSNGGAESMCGWCTDRFGISWQITPVGLLDMMRSGDPAAVERLMSAFMHMRKLDIAALENAFNDG